MSWGGRRSGAGRKPKREPSGDEYGVFAPPTGYPPARGEAFDPPTDLTPAERTIWVLQAPHAVSQGTLTPTSALSFARYCRVVVLEQEAAAGAFKGGANHLGLMKQVNTFELQFLLTACGKPMPDVVPATPAMKLGRFVA